MDFTAALILEVHNLRMIVRTLMTDRGVGEAEIVNLLNVAHDYGFAMYEEGENKS